jgi:hypothetical protein
MVTALTTWPTADTNATEALWGEMVSSWFTDGVCGDDTTNHFQVTADGSGMQVFVDRPAGFRQDADGMVYLRGFVHGGSSGSYMFTLPPGCHPLYNEVFSIIHDAPASSGLIIINQVGQIIPILQAGFSEVSLASIQFQADGS